MPGAETVDNEQCMARGQRENKSNTGGNSKETLTVSIKTLVTDSKSSEAVDDMETVASLEASLQGKSFNGNNYLRVHWVP